MISFETFTQIQDRIAGNARAPARRNLDADTRAMFEALCSRRLASQVESKRMLEAQRSKIDRQVEQFLDRIADTIHHDWRTRERC